MFFLFTMMKKFIFKYKVNYQVLLIKLISIYFVINVIKWQRKKNKNIIKMFIKINQKLTSYRHDSV